MHPSRLSQWYANLASSRQLFWLVDLPLDVYLFYMVFGSLSLPLQQQPSWKMAFSFCKEKDPGDQEGDANFFSKMPLLYPICLTSFVVHLCVHIYVVTLNLWHCARSLFQVTSLSVCTHVYMYSVHMYMCTCVHVYIFCLSRFRYLHIRCCNRPRFRFSHPEFLD